MSIEAVLFDYFFTLAEPADAGRDFFALARALGSTSSAAEVERARAEATLARPSAPSPCFDGEPPPFRCFRDRWLDYGDDVFRRLGLEGGGDAMATARARDHREALAYADAHPAIASLRERGLKIGVVSDADTEHLEASIAANGFVFDGVVWSEGAGCYKPHVSLFAAACRALEVDPSAALFVGDSPVTDIEGARRAGLHAAWINRRALPWPDDLAPPVHVIESLTDVVDLVTR